MRVKIEEKVVKNIYKKHILQQTAVWSWVKWFQGINSKAFDITVNASDLYTPETSSKSVFDDLLILFQNIGHDYQIGYVP